jgi:hypothetical protein
MTPRRSSRFVVPLSTQPKTVRAPRRRIEKNFQAAVIELITYRQLWCFHIVDSRTAPAGWPDLTILGQGGALYRELKTATGRLSKDQKRVIGLLEAAGQNVKVWRPADLQSGLVVRELDAIRRPRPQFKPEDLEAILPSTSYQTDAGRVPLERIIGNLDMSSVSVAVLVQYMIKNGIPMDAHIAADTFHDKPFLELVWK